MGAPGWLPAPGGLAEGARAAIAEASEAGAAGRIGRVKRAILEEGSTWFCRDGAACAVLAASPGLMRARAASDASARAALDRFFYDVPSSRDLANKAYGVLVFPTVVKAGFGFGGEYGEGALFIRGARPAIIAMSRAPSASSSARRRGPSSSCS